jgi:hypothetical protein
MKMNYPAANNGRHGSAGKLTAIKRRVAAL